MRRAQRDTSIPKTTPPAKHIYLSALSHPTKFRALTFFSSIVVTVLFMYFTNGRPPLNAFTTTILLLWILPTGLYWLLIRTPQVSVIGGLCLLVVLVGLLIGIETTGSSTAGLGYVFMHLWLDLIVLASIGFDIVLRRRVSETARRNEASGQG